MSSPFPGMDPYLEDPDIFPDLHNILLVAIRASLTRLLPPGYTAWMDRYVWLQEPDTGTRTRFGKPDTFVTNGGASVPPAAPSGTGIDVLAAPLVHTVQTVREEGQRFVRIVDRHNRRLITVLELLSPSNKEGGADRDAYLRKRGEYQAARTNLVEIDLLRSGQRPPQVEPLPDGTDYDIFVSRAIDYPRVAVWPFTVREPFPPLLIPLLPEDGVVRIDLQACFERCYDEAGFDRKVDYTQPPPIPLTEADAVWARERLAARPR